MQDRAAKTAQSKRAGQQASDPRFAAFARLLARDLAKKHFDQEKGKKQLKASQASGYDSDSQPKGKS